MKRLTLIIASLVVALSLASCSSMSNKDKGVLAGGAIGAAAGGLITHSPAGAAVGAAAGGLGGYYIGKNMGN